MRALSLTLFALVACGGAPADVPAGPLASPAAAPELSEAPRVPRLRTSAGSGLVLGGLTPKQVETAIAGSMASAVACLNGSRGTVQVRLILKSDGSVKKWRVKAHDVGDDAAAACAAAALASSTFPEPDGGGLTIVTWPVIGK